LKTTVVFIQSEPTGIARRPASHFTLSDGEG
jgi:hypothetical protein